MEPKLLELDFRRGTEQFHRWPTETHLRLCIDVGSSFHQDFHYFTLTSQRGYVEGCVSFLD